MNKFQFLSKGFINSYSQLFFADSKIFAWLLLLSSFVSPSTGLSGLVAIVSSLAFAWWIGLDRTLISYGTYSYNALMLGLVLGSQYNFTLGLAAMLITGSVLSVLLVVWLNTMLLKYKLPSLSLSFLLSYWVVVLCIRNLSGIEVSDSGIFRYNEWYKIGGNALVDLMTTVENAAIPGFIQIYLKSLSAIFFQYNIIAGAIILIGLITWSRIGFLLSLIGFTTGYLFYYTFAGDFSELSYSYIGFNFVLSAIAIGGFYTVPSRASFTLAIVSMPLIAMLINAFTGLLAVYQLPFYSLPFVLTVLLVIMMLQQRVYGKNLALVTYQYFSPEKNLYQYSNNISRFKNNTPFSLQLPFYGEWYVSQGNNGDITHREAWKNALDFVVVDELTRTYKLPGDQATDFFCYNLPVLTPADGYVTEVLDGVNDNAINDVNLEQNWGNTIVIKHAEGLFTKLSHLKKDSITVKVNDYVRSGQVVATCGNSGRSPEPHLHFQAQATSFIGSKTLEYPLAYFVSRRDKTFTFHSYETPKEGSHVHNPVKTGLLAKAFHFTPGQQITWRVERMNTKTREVSWECMVNAWNQTYFYCKETRSTAYFVNNGTLFYFTDFYGDKRSLLFDLYLGAQKVMLGYYDQMIIEDTLPPNRFHHPLLLKFHDLVAPFYRFMEVSYQSRFVFSDDVYHPKNIVIHSEVKAMIFNRETKLRAYELHFSSGKLAGFKIIHPDQYETTVTCTG